LEEELLYNLLTSPFDIDQAVRKATLIYRSLVAGMGVPERLSADTPDAFTFLQALGYLREDGSLTGDQVARTRRLSILDVAANCYAIFPIGHWSPGKPYLVGASLSCAEFDATVDNRTIVHAGGRGIHLQAAFESCIGELVERHAVLPKRDELKRPVRVNSLLSEEDSLVPAELFFTPPNEVGKSAAVGTTAEQSRCKALFELIERNAVAQWWSKQESRPCPRDVEFPKDMFERTNRRRWFIDLTTDIGIPVIGALSSTLSGESIVMGAAAGSRYEAVAVKAALELYQMEHAAALSVSKVTATGSNDLSDGDLLWMSRLESHHTSDFPCFVARGFSRTPDFENLTSDKLAKRLHNLAREVFLKPRETGCEGLYATVILSPGFPTRPKTMAPSPAPI
jgi:hypothetical protein